jgi:hypothetical protein
MAESAAEALASLSVMATQHATADRPSDYAPDGHPGMVELLFYYLVWKARDFVSAYFPLLLNGSFCS